MAPSPRFPIHLCQPDYHKSCAACCGIYNFKDNSRRAVSLRLHRNRVLLGNEGRKVTPDALALHSQKWRSRYNGFAKRFEAVFNCEFVGFLDEAHRRVGCLLHPLRHKGKDLRHSSFYGQELCDGHFCPSYYELTMNEQALVVKTLDDWYLYGLVITDIDLVKGVYQALSDRLGEAVQPRMLTHPPVQRALRRLWQWKLRWPYCRPGCDGFGKYLFIGDHYEELQIPYERWGVQPSFYHRILLALGSAFQSLEELRDAERIIDLGLHHAVQALRNASSQKSSNGTIP
ncbi:hypothetical protein [Desulfosoma caldarium]|uniref:Uncharacterized protein n=1 Tax=Desulfosoma caldarium TaxID=610254 RepID=A0A3N1VJJ5_9BACT|nr:hypothetical protein [Desulfosoma caldarium]ROR02984.1 hypothetical protein EDC27_0239 [Desulfosoma caldarium]